MVSSTSAIDMQIRVASPADQGAIAALYRAAFPDSERDAVASLALELLAEPEVLTLVAEAGAQIVGHIAFSPLRLDGDRHWRGAILAPLAVAPERQKQGVGSALIETGLSRLAGEGIEWLCVYGDPAYYGRFGFTADFAEPFKPPYPLEYPFGWLALPLGGRDAPATGGTIGCVAPLMKATLW